MAYNSIVGTLIILLSSLAATLLDSAINDRKHSKKQNNTDDKVNVGNELFSHLLISFVIYVVISVAIVAFYALVRSIHGISSFLIIFENLIGYYIKKHAIEFFFVPIFAYALTQLMHINRRKKIAISIAISVLLIFSPIVIQFDAPNRFPMESEILTELRSINIPYEGRLVNIAHFREKTDDGYWIEERLEPEPDGGESADEYFFEENPSTLTEYVNNCAYYFNNEDGENAAYWIEKAYEFYLAGGSASQNAIGRMWFYKGYYEDLDYYLKAAETFINDDEYYNAALSYLALYEENPKSDYLYPILECYIQAVSFDDSSIQSQRRFKDIVCNVELNDMMTYVKEMHDRIPEDVFLSALLLNDNYVSGKNTYSDEELVNNILAKEKYAHCPKLMILHALYNQGELPAECADIYELYLSHGEFFEPEDQVNLAWMLYKTEEYVKAYQIAVGMFDSTGEKEHSVLLRAESFLQNEVALSETDKETLYRDVSEVIDAGTASTESLQRLRLVQCILAGKLGLDPNFTNLSEICTSLFGEQSVTGMYIVASLNCREGMYDETIAMCNKILNQIEAPNYFYNSVLFLKADALMNCAKNSSRDERQPLYEEAEHILNTVRENIGNDYITCLQKLNELYKVMDNRDQELQEIADILMHLK